MTTQNNTDTREALFERFTVELPMQLGDYESRLNATEESNRAYVSAILA